MRRIVVYTRQGMAAGELGGVWSTIGAIAGVTAGQTAQAAGLPGWASGLIGAGGNIVAGLLSQPPEQGPLEDDGEIAAAIDAMAAQYRQAQSQMPADQLLQLAAAMLAALENPQIFGTPRHEGGRAYLAQAREVFRREVARLQALVGTGGGGGTATPGTQPPGQTIAGVPLKTLLIVGAGGAVIWLILR